MNIFNKINMRGRKEDIVIIVFALILIVIVFTIVLIITTFKQTPQIQNNTDININTPSNISKPTATDTSLPSPTPSSQAEGANPPLSYDQTASKKLLNYFENRQILSNGDTFAKANILSLLPSGEQSGVIYQSSDISIEYVNTADIFLVEIRTTNIQAAKNAANLWFQEHGLSQQGICTFPVEFYMNYDIANKLRNSTILFSPLPNGC